MAFLSCLLFICSQTLFAARGLGTPLTGKEGVTFEFYYHYSSEDHAYENQDRLTVSMYNINKSQYIIAASQGWEIQIDKIINHILNSPSYSFIEFDSIKYTNYLIEKYPFASIYYSNIKKQIECHIIGEITRNPQKEWDIEIQRNPGGIEDYARYHCNRANWTDNKLLFHPNVKFHGQTPVPNQWISYQKNGKSIYYYVDENYVGVTGWKFVDAWYYFDDFAVMQAGWLNYNNKWYYLHESGRMLTGVRQLGENYYVLNHENGELQHSGWISDNGKWYYSPDTGGSLVRDKWYKIGEVWYYFNSDATMKTGWLRYGNKWYFLHSNGAMVTGWQDIGESRYYFKSSGEMLTGVHTIDGIEYEFNNSGHLVRRGKFPTDPPICNKYTCIMPYSNDKGVSE